MFRSVKLLPMCSYTYYKLNAALLQVWYSVGLLLVAVIAWWRYKMLQAPWTLSVGTQAYTPLQDAGYLNTPLLYTHSDNVMLQSCYTHTCMSLGVHTIMNNSGCVKVVELICTAVLYAAVISNAYLYVTVREYCFSILTCLL